MTKFYLHSNGTLTTQSEAGVTDAGRHLTKVDDCLLEEHKFLITYGLNPTVYNIANLRRCKDILLSPLYAKTVVEHGAMASVGCLNRLNACLIDNGFEIVNEELRKQNVEKRIKFDEKIVLVDNIIFKEKQKLKLLEDLRQSIIFDGIKKSEL